jgi:acetylornithine deacetylase
VAWPTLNLGCIHGGDNPNRICGSAELHFDLRMTPGGDNDAVRGDLQRRLATIATRRDLAIALQPLIDPIAPFEQAAGSELVRLAERLTGHGAGAAAFATEAPFLQRLGMETIVMGPGSIDQAHQPDEFLALDQVGPCVALLEQCIRRYCL